MNIDVKICPLNSIEFKINIIPIIFWLISAAMVSAQDMDRDHFKYGEMEFSAKEGKAINFVEESGLMKPISVDKVDLSSMFPPAGDQGNISSCWAWSTTYAYMTFMKNRLNPKSIYLPDSAPNYSRIYSPAFTYHRYEDSTKS